MTEQEELARKHAACAIELWANDQLATWSILFIGLGLVVIYVFLPHLPGGFTPMIVLLAVGVRVSRSFFERRAQKICDRIFH